MGDAWRRLALLWITGALLMRWWWRCAVDAPVSKARRMSKMPEIEVAVRNAMIEAHMALFGCEPIVRRIANALIKERRLTGDEVIAIMDGRGKKEKTNKRLRRRSASATGGKFGPRRDAEDRRSPVGRRPAHDC